MTDPASSTPLSLHALEVVSYLIPAHGLTPNTSLQSKPLLIYRSALQPLLLLAREQQQSPAARIETHLRRVAVVEPAWRYTMYSTSHFHSTAHEVLCVARGAARVCFGHEANPERVEETLRAGDVVLVPAGVAHRLLLDLKQGEGCGEGFEMVGSCYPLGRTWDMCYGEPGEEERVKRIQELGWFEKDPIYGSHGPVLKV